MNKDEIEVLHDQDEFLFKLYFAGMRQHMDYRSGIVGGVKRRISLRCLQETMFICPRAGVAKENSGLPHKSKIRRAICQLEKIGLIKSIPDKKYLIFSLPMATRDESVQNKADTKQTQKTTHEANTLNIKTKPVNIELHVMKADTDADKEIVQQADTHPLSVKSKEKETHKKQCVSKKKTQIPENFAVTENHMHLARENQWPNPDTEIEAFKDYHMARGSVFLDWDRAFYTWLRNAIKFKGGNRGGNNQYPERKNSFDRAIENMLNSPTRAR